MSPFQYGSLPRTSTVQTLTYLMHKWHLAMHTQGALIDHDKLLETLTNIGVRLALVDWFGSYFHGRSQMTSFQAVQSEIKGGVPQANK